MESIISVAQEPVYVPQNLEECFDELEKILTPQELEEFKNQLEEEVLNNYHPTTGMWIRNNWGLWAESSLTEYFNSIGILDASPMSNIILISFHRYLNNRDIGLEEQVRYWQEEMAANPPEGE